MNSIAAHIQKWPTAYQVINIPHFLMYIAIIYYLCQKEFYTAAWVLFALITLVTVDFIILSKKIFEMEDTVMTRMKGGSNTATACAISPQAHVAAPAQPPPITMQPQPSQPISQFTSQPSSAFRLEPGQEIGSYLEAAGYQHPPLNVAMQPPPINSATVMVKS